MRFRNRTLDIQQMRWEQIDPVRYKSSLSLYDYENTNPNNHIDAAGLYPDSPYYPTNFPYPPGLTPEKVTVIITIGPLDTLKIYEFPDQASDAVKNDPGPWGGIGDAIKHCTWMCLTAAAIGKDKALQIGDIHEDFNPPSTPGGKLPRGYLYLWYWAMLDSKMGQGEQ
jgi:hypothetical protein